MPREATTGWVLDKMKNGKKVYLARWINEKGKTSQKQCKTRTEARKVAAQMTMKATERREEIDQVEGATLTPKTAGVAQPSPVSPQVAALRGRGDFALFDEVIEKYEAALSRGYNGAAPLKANTLHGYQKHHRYWSRVFAASAEEGVSWIESAATVRDELLDIAAEPKSRFGRKTAKAKFDQLKRVCAFAVAEGLANKNPVAGQEIKLAVAAEKVRSKAIKKEAVYRPEEIKALLKAADELCEDRTIDARSRRSWQRVYRPLLHTLIQSGMRISEAQALTRQNVDLENNVLSIEAAADFQNNTDTPKSANAVRDIPVTKGAADQLKHAMQWHRHKYVFASATGNVRSYNTLRDFLLLPVCKRAEVPVRGFHGFRHYFASAHIANGTPVLKLSKLLGHHTPSFTMDVYAHFFEDDDAAPLDLTG